MKTQNDQREILYRLLKRLTDGSYEVVGYEFHLQTPKGIRIYHGGIPDLKKLQEQDFWWDISFPVTYRKHDRKDQFTGITLDDGTRVFERDEIRATINGLYLFSKGWITETKEGYVRFVDGKFIVNGRNSDNTEYKFCEMIELLKESKITGIEGVVKKP